MKRSKIDNPVLGYDNGRRVWRFDNGDVLPVIGGGEGPVAMPTVPEDLSTLTDEQIGGLHDELLGWFSARREELREAGALTAEHRTELETCVTHIEALRNDAARRYAEAGDGGGGGAPPEAFDIDDLESRLGTPAVEPEVVVPEVVTLDTIIAPAIDPALIASLAQSVGAEVGRAVVTAMNDRPADPAAGAIPLAVLNRYANRAQQPPEANAPSGLFPATVTAAMGLPNVEYGAQIPDARSLAEAMCEVWNRGHAKVAVGAGERFPIAHLVASAPDEQRLTRNDSEQAIAAKVEAMLTGRTLTAAGGLCAPVTPIYDQPVISTALRPFRAGFPTFIADRGGVRIVTPPTMADITGTTPPDPNPGNLGDGVGIITVSEDAAGSPLKSCLDVPCHTSAEYDVQAIYRCLQFGNLGARVFPENVEAFNRVTMASWARLAETALIDAVSAVAHQKTFAKTFGTSRQLLAQLEHAAAHYRNVNRMDPNAVLQVRLPAWAINSMRCDITQSWHDDPELFSAADATLNMWFADRNLAVDYYIDSGTGKGQLFAAIGSNGSAFPNFPSTVVSYMWAEGTFLFLDGGTLDVGLVRDSTLVAENRFRDFSESWEGLAWTGLPAYELTHTVCADGSFGAAIEIACASGSGL